MVKKTIELKWAESTTYADVKNSNHPGFYCITTVYNGQPSKLLYIGKSSGGSIKGRLSNHKKDWLSKYHGVRITFARLSPEVHDSLSDEDILCIENAMIYAYEPIENTQGKNKLREDFANHCFTLKHSGYTPYKFKPTLDMEKLLLTPKPKSNQKSGTPRKSNKKEEFDGMKWLLG